MREAFSVTGMGIVSALGEGCAQTLAALDAGRVNALPQPRRFSCGVVKPVFEAVWDRSQDLVGVMPTLNLARSAVMQAYAQARWHIKRPGRIGVCIGTTIASQLNDIPYHREFRDGNVSSYAPAERFVNGNLAEAIARECEFVGPTATPVNACSSGTDAIGIALSWLRAGLCDAVVAGGADELHQVPMAGFNSLGILSSDICRPYDAARSGLNLGEGAGIVILESSASVAARNATVLARCAGYGTAADAYHLTAPRPDGSGLERAVRTALDDAGIDEDAIGFINVHGTATQNNDLAEGTTLARIFGPDVVLYASKGYTGHALGAAGGIEAVLTVLALREGRIPAAAGFSTSDPAIGVAPVSVTTQTSARYALSTSLAFGGNNSAVVFGGAA